MNALPPEVHAALDEVGSKIAALAGPAILPAGTTKTEAKSYAWYNPMKYIRMGAMAGLSLALMICVGAVLTLTGFIVGTTSGYGAAASILAKDAPIKVAFESGSVEDYGFIRNFLWRNSDKKFEVNAVIQTELNGTRTLAEQNVKALRENGSAYTLKQGTTNVWTLVPPVEKPKPIEKTEVAQK